MTYATQIAETGSIEDGLQKLKATLKGGPDDRDVYITLANLYTRLRRYPEAEEATEKAAQLSTKSEEKQGVDFLRGTVYERQKRTIQAEDQFRRGLKRRPAKHRGPQLPGLYAGGPQPEAGRSL